MRRGGRLFLLLGLVVAALGAFLAYYFFIGGGGGGNSGQVLPIGPSPVPLKNVVVARIDIPANTVLTDTESYLKTQDIKETDYNANPKNFFTAISEVQGKLVLRSITADLPVRAADVTDAGLSFRIPAPQQGQPQLKAYPLAVNNLTGVADQIKPGDYVDVLSSFNIAQVFVRPGVNDLGTPIAKEQELTSQATKTLVQSVQVLQILKPRQEAAGTPTPGRAPTPGPAKVDSEGKPVQEGAAVGPDAGSPDTFVPGTWVLILAISDQQAEVLEYARQKGTGITLVLRGRGDTAVENTFGATLDLLISRFGVPIPNQLPPASLSGGLTPQPGIVTPVPGASTPGPTPTARP